ncbi:hypothetical protein [Spirosoma agri]|uniref:Uncharacterized protein n=1 Tax=Spirosoma agri TaxID=1987381 RepID=A0A6M0IJ51_9BACT|nr:hypothetical protein [Spirosoma agri]NEU68288.1 hypothetical protein [Spirosoma agri]
MTLRPFKASDRVVSTAEIRLNADYISKGIIQITSSASPGIIRVGTKGFVISVDKDHQRIYLDLMESGHFGLFLNISLTSFGRFFKLEGTVG